MRDDDARLGLVLVPGDAAGEREVVAEDEGKGELELWKDERVEMLTSRIGESVEEDSCDWVEN